MSNDDTRLGKLLLSSRHGPAFNQRQRLALALVFFSLLALYLRTSPPSLLTGDSGELITAAAGFGVPHPTGYPAYMLMSHAALRFIPLGNAASRISLLSAVAGAAAASLVTSLLLLRSVPLVLAVWGGMVTGLSPHFWAQANSPEVYSLNLLLQILVWHLLLVPIPRNSQQRLALAMLALGIGLTHHGTAWLSLPAIVCYVLWTFRGRESWLRLLRSLPFLVFGCAVLVFLPIRSQLRPYVNWGQPDQIAPFLRHISGSQFQGLMMTSGEGTAAHHRSVLSSMLLRHFGWPAVLAVPIVLAVSWRKQLAIKGFLALIAVFGWGFAQQYRIPDIEPFFMPALAALTIMFVLDSARVVCTRSTSVNQRIAFGATLAIGLLMNAVSGYWPADRSRNTLAVDYAKVLLDTPTEPAAITSYGWTAPFAMMYALEVENYRDDITIVTPLLQRIPTQQRRPQFYTVYPSASAATGDIIAQQALLFSLQPAGEAPISRPEPVCRPIRGEDTVGLYLSDLDRALLADIATKRAMAADADGKAPQAIRYIHRALALARHNAKLLNNLGNAHLRAGRTAAALQLLREARRMNPELPESLLNEGNALMVAGRYAEARDRFMAYFEQNPEAPLPLISLGDALNGLGDYTTSVLYFRKAAQLVPGQPAVLNRLGLAEARNNNPAKAIDAFLLAQAISTPSPESMVNLGLAYAAAGRLKQAERCYRDALKLAPDTPSILNNLANVLVRQQHCAEAEHLLMRAIELRPDFVFRNNLAGMFIECGESERAIPLLEALLAERPESREAQLNLNLARSVMRQRP